LLNNYDETISWNQVKITSPAQVCAVTELNNSLIDNHLYSCQGVALDLEVRPKAQGFGIKTFGYRINLREADEVRLSTSKGPDSDRGPPFE